MCARDVADDGLSNLFEGGAWLGLSLGLERPRAFAFGRFCCIDHKWATATAIAAAIANAIASKASRQFRIKRDSGKRLAQRVFDGFGYKR